MGCKGEWSLVSACFVLSTGLFLLSYGAELHSDIGEHVTELPSQIPGPGAHGANASSHGEIERYQIAQLDWGQVATAYTICLWILLASVAKLGFHLSKKFASIFPDSSLLIVLGLLVGLILYFIQTDEGQFHLPSTVFFIYLLPPIVFDAGYFMPNRAFFDNLGTILVYAVFGTLWNTLTIGLSLWAVSLTQLFHWKTPLLHVLVFSSLISAVDPVAVLVVFEEIQVNAMLYITVFGESLLNDAVTVVLYEMFESFAKIGGENLLPVDIASGFAAFFVVSLGGVIIGLIWALVCSYTTKFTKHVRVIEPQLILLMAYLAYLTAQMFHLSAILAIVFCGITMKQYVEENISQKSKTVVQYLLKMVCSSCETAIFMFLGLSTVTKDHGWDTAFVALTVLFCLVYRAIGVVILTFFVNKRRLIKLNKVDQFIMSYGGLRGAIAYGLVSALDEEHFPAKKMFVTTTIVVIYFTVFLQGMTIKPLVNFLKVKKEEHIEPSMCAKIFGRNIDHLVAGVETLIGAKGHHWRRMKFENFNEKYLKPLLLRRMPQEKDTSITKVFTELNMKAAMDHVEKFGTFHSSMDKMQNVPPLPDNVTYGGQPLLTDGLHYQGAYTNPAFQNSSDYLQETSPRELLAEKLDGRRYSRDVTNDPSPMPIRRPKPASNSVRHRLLSVSGTMPTSNGHLMPNNRARRTQSADHGDQRPTFTLSEIKDNGIPEEEPEAYDNSAFDRSESPTAERENVTIEIPAITRRLVPEDAAPQTPRMGHESPTPSYTSVIEVLEPTETEMTESKSISPRSENKSIIDSDEEDISSRL